MYIREEEDEEEEVSGDRDGNQYGPQRKHDAAVVQTSNRRIANGEATLRVYCLLRCSL